MIKIELSYIKDILINILKSEKYKFFYDCRNDFNILEKKLNISYEIFNNCIDLQKDNISMKEILEKSNINHYLKKDIKNIMNESNQRNVDIWLHRPIHRDLLIYSMLDAYCTYKIYEKNKLIDYKNLSHLVEFTRNKYEHYKYGKIIKDTNIIIDSDINSIINLLDIDEDLEDIREMIKISTDIFIDSNRYLSFNKHGKLTINKNIYITKNKIKNIIEKCDWEESEDNRYIFGKTLHRLSKVFYNNDFFGLTLRIGRTISGLDALLPNYLFEKNILICGPPNVGKTSLLRTLCKYFSEINSLCLIDSSNEVVGCPFTNNIIGNTRTFSPQKIEDQYKLLIDIVKNHSPKYVVIDEIHTKKEINICSTIMKRGINMIAAVHGNFNELIYNNDLNEVLGGIQSTILSGNQDRKMRTERDKKSSFDIIIQINYNEKENRYEYIFIDNIDDNIDEILNKKYVKSNMRYIKNNKVYEIETFLN